MIEKIVIKNYKKYGDRFEVGFNPDLNILVGDNESGKSTVLEAIGLALTGRLRGRQFASELSPQYFNQAVTLAYVTALRAGKNPVPPEMIIDLYLTQNQETVKLLGRNNITKENACGTRLHVLFNEEFADEYAAFLAEPSAVTLIPTEYYKVEWKDFAGNSLVNRKLPVTASLIDASSIRLQSGTDYYMQRIIQGHLEQNERVELARAYRSLRQTFSSNPSIANINTKLNGKPGEISDKNLSIAIDTSQQAGWEAAIVPHLDDLPVHLIGHGEQSALKILLALNRRAEEAHIILVEEPENHLSFSRLAQLVKKIQDKCIGKQVIVTTHSSFVLNKLGLGRLLLFSGTGAMRLTDLDSGTQDYFMKLSGYDTLRLILAKKVILVEGPSDELVVQRAYLDRHHTLPLERAVDVINVRGLSFKRFLRIAQALRIETHVVTDNDGNYQKNIVDKYVEFKDVACISIHASRDESLKTLEPQLLGVNRLAGLNQILDKEYLSDDEMLKHMSENKTSVGLAILATSEAVVIPEYIRNAVE